MTVPLAYSARAAGGLRGRGHSGGGVVIVRDIAVSEISAEDKGGRLSFSEKGLDRLSGAR